MNKLGSKEIFLILVIINFLLYYLAYMCIIKPIAKTGSGYSEEIEVAQADYDQKKETVDGIPQLDADIQNLENDKAQKLADAYPKGYAEDVQLFMTKLISDKQLTLINVPQVTSKPVTEKNSDGEEVATKVTNNNITVSISGSYKTITEFLETMEQKNKGAKLTSYKLEVKEGVCEATANYLMLTVDKGNDKDNTFSKNTTDFLTAGQDPEMK
jgi:Tfp pilus assembly protein PilO